MTAALFGAIPPSIRFLAVFATASYVAWLVAFTVYRYAIPLELVASLLLVLAMHAALVGAVRRDVLIGIANLAVVTVTIPPYWGAPDRIPAATSGSRCRRSPPLRSY